MPTYAIDASETAPAILSMGKIRNRARYFTDKLESGFFDNRLKTATVRIKICIVKDL
jgi:hypothetical protein